MKHWYWIICVGACLLACEAREEAPQGAAPEESVSPARAEDLVATPPPSSTPSATNEADAAPIAAPTDGEVPLTLETVTLGHAPPRLNAAVVEESSFETKMAVSHRKGDAIESEFERSTREVTKKKTTVTALGPASEITALTVAYEDRASHVSQDGTEQTVASPLSGKTYVVELGPDGAIVVRIAGVEDADSAPSNESTEVRADHPTFGAVNPLQALLPKEPLAPGGALPFALDDAARLFAQTEATVSMTRATMIYRGTRALEVGRVAVLEAVFELGLARGELMSMKLDLSGEIEVLVESGWLRSMRLEGAVDTTGKITVDGEERVMHGTGTVTMLHDASYE